MTSLHVKIAALAAVLMLSAAPGLAEDAKIKIANFTFDPPTLTVTAGTTVTWVNIPHVVSEKNGTFRSKRARHRRELHADVPGGRHHRVFLRDPSAHDRKNHRHALNEARLKGVRLPTGWMWATRQIRIGLPRCFCLTSSMPFGSPAGLPAAVPMPRISCRRLRSGPSKAFAD